MVWLVEKKKKKKKKSNDDDDDDDNDVDDDDNSSDDGSDDAEEDENDSEQRSWLAELNWRRMHPERLHDELWFNLPQEASQCRCQSNIDYWFYWLL